MKRDCKPKKLTIVIILKPYMVKSIPTEGMAQCVNKKIYPKVSPARIDGSSKNNKISVLFRFIIDEAYN